MESPYSMLWIFIKFLLSISYYSVEATVNNTMSTQATSTNNNTITTIIKQVSPSPSISGMALRAFYVIIAVSSLVIVYFIARAVCSRKRRNNTRRYGILRTNQDQMEMHPLSEAEDDDEEDDLTLFDINQEKRKSKR